MSKVRCAIYTRKSSEDGLEQDFNSLHAQRESCAAYVLSQASEGWSLLPESYDDGGLSGGSLERPALRLLLQDIEAGKIDIVVVYKVDRLTRSLLDFAKLVEAFDKAGTSFVSVTQSFNTTTSMGRLTLNMLLSFAQFEREVTAERIRDKIAASKSKGMWMGGVPPLGYQPDGRSLAIVQPHAKLINELFSRYLVIGNVRLLADELEAEGINVPQRTIGTGRALGGGVFTRGQLYKILSNPIYVGEIHHRGKIYPGKHAAIIDRDVWDQVQAKLADNLQGRERSSNVGSLSLLAGKVFAENHEPLVAAHACKGKVRYRYYVSRSLQHGPRFEPDKGIRIPALDLEKVVAQGISEAFADPLSLAGICGFELRPDAMARYNNAARDIASRAERRERSYVRALVSKVRVNRDRIAVELDVGVAASKLGIQRTRTSPATTTLTIDASLRRTGLAVRFVQPVGKALAAAEPQQHLVRLLIRARAWWNEMVEHSLAVSEIAHRNGVTRSYVSRVVRLNFLAPSIIETILVGEHPATLDARTLLGLHDLSPCWSQQQRDLRLV